MDSSRSSKCSGGWAIAGQIWEEKVDAIQPHQITPHYCHSIVVQTIPTDGSILGNLAHTILEVITTLRGKPKLQETLQMTTEQMELIDKEMTTSNVRRFGKSSVARALHPTITWMTEYQQHVDVAKMAKPRQFYTSWDVQAGRRSILNIIETLNDDRGRSRHQTIFYTYLRRALNWHCLTEIRIAARSGMATPMNQGRKEQFRNYWMSKQSLNITKRCSGNIQRWDGNTCSWERWRVDGDNVGRTKTLVFEYCAHIHGMGQVMLESQE